MPLFFVLLSLYLIRADGIAFYLFLLYVLWMFFFQRMNVNGGHPQRWMRSLIVWKWFADFFPCTLHKTVDLPADRNYIFGYHPHGIISFGAFANFATDATGFSALFPGINIRLLTLATNFRIPFYGLYLTSLGICDASAESCHNILTKGVGHSLMLVLGGAKESLDARPGTFDLTLKDRKGFVKIALLNGASMVPVFAFGETDVYDQVDNPRGSTLRRVQNVLQNTLGFAIPLVKGRGVFNYRMGLLPHRRAIHTVVGEPIPVPKMDVAAITGAVLDQYHARYIEALTSLFDRYKDIYAPNRAANMRIVQ